MSDCSVVYQFSFTYGGYSENTILPLFYSLWLSASHEKALFAPVMRHKSDGLDNLDVVFMHMHFYLFIYYYF